MTKLTNKIININNRRTSMRLCLEEWEALEDICTLESINRNRLIEEIENKKCPTLGLTYATRLFLMLYYRAHKGEYESPCYKDGMNNNITSIVSALA